MRTFENKFFVSNHNFLSLHEFNLRKDTFSKIEDLEKKPAQAYKKVSKLIAQIISVYKPSESPGALIDFLTTTMSKISKRFLTFSPDCKYILNYFIFFGVPCMLSLGSTDF